MENPTKGQYYYVKQYGSKIGNVVRYHEYRAKFLGKEPGANNYMSYNKINYYQSNYRPTYLISVSARNIIKMENLKDITNEMLPNDLLLKIDEYL